MSSLLPGQQRTNRFRCAAHPFTNTAVAAQPGETLLVGVTSNHQPQAVVVASAGNRSDARIRSASQLALCETTWQHLPKLAWEAAPWCLHPLAPQLTVRLVEDRQPTTTQLSGRSYGLALALGFVSSICDVALHTHVAALAVVHEAGTTHPVDGLGAKLLLLRDACPTITSVLVHPSQAAEVEHADFRAIGVPHLHSAIPHALPSSIAAASPDPATLRWHAQHLIRWTRNGRPAPTDWRPVARTIAQLQALPELADIEAQLDFSLAIAERHCDKNHALPWPSDATAAAMPRPLRQQTRAHVVQSLTDSSHQNLDPVVTKVRACLPEPIERDACDLMLLGALGRLLLQNGRLHEARTALHSAIHGWERIDRLHEASMPACALLLVLGWLGEPSAVRDLAPTLKLIEREATDINTPSYLRYAHGRALIQCGEPTHGKRVLQELLELPNHDRVRAGALRWLARTGEPHHTTQGAQSQVVQALVAIDQAARGGIDTTELGEALQELAPKRFDQLARWCPSHTPVAIHVADHWPY